MSTGTALGLIAVALAAGLAVTMAGVLSVVRRKGRLPSTGETMMIVIAVGVAVIGVICVLAPDSPAAPVMVTPTTYGPPPDPLAGYDSSELP